jgi:DNA-binding beta-propeller fold protein YncE
MGAIVAGQASASTLCTLGSAAGQCDQPEAIAVDAASGNAYVADSANNRIDVFDTSGSFLFAFGWGVTDGAAGLERCTTATGCLKGLKGSGPGEFDRPSQIAIDSSAKIAYVFDKGSFRVQEFDLEGNFIRQLGSSGSGECQFENTNRPLAIGPGGVLYVGEVGQVQKYSATGECKGEVLLPGVETVEGLAVSATGEIYVTTGGMISKHNSAGSLVCEPSSNPETRGGIALDGAGNLFAGQRAVAALQPFNYAFVTEYDPSCSVLRRFSYSPINSEGAPISGVAPFASIGGDFYLSQHYPGDSGGSRVSYLFIPPPGPVAPLPGLEVVESSITTTKARLQGEINPEGRETTYHFEYLTQEEWEEQGESFTGTATKSTPFQILTATDFELHGVEVEIGCSDPVNDPPSACLQPETAYRYRLVATNADGVGEGTTGSKTFETRSWPGSVVTYATGVSLDSARLNAEVNPLGIPTTGYFEYVDDATFQQSGFQNAIKVPDPGAGEPELDFGAGEEVVTHSVELTALPSGTTFHYRISLTNPILGGARVSGWEQFFRTSPVPSIPPCPGNAAFRTGPSALPGDCRAYEMVSPLEKGSGDVIVLGEFETGLPATIEQSAVSGSKITYGSYRSFGDAQSAPYTSQYVAERSEDGWRSHSVNGPRGHLNIPVLSSLDTEFKAFSPDLCNAWVETMAEPPLAAGAIPGNRNLYRRHDGGDCGATSYEALTTHKRAHPEAISFLMYELQGLSADGAISIYTANDNLKNTGAPTNLDGREQLYENGPSGTSFVCILPGGAPTSDPCTAGSRFSGVVGQSRNSSLDNAISADGQRIFWTDYHSAAAPNEGPGRIYLRIGGTKTIPVSQGGEEESGAPDSSVFLKASDDGSEALYLTGNAVDGEDLFEFDVEGETTTPVAQRVAGILGASEDLSRIYLVSREVLAGANAAGVSPAADEPNLYLDEEGTFTFIATLDARDAKRFVPSSTGISPISLIPQKRSSRVTADGGAAIFTSFANPTGYDNTDAKNGEADMELYRYDAASEGLDCVSCAPTNARPVGANIAPKESVGAGVWGAGWIFGWENVLYAPRNLSADGRRVFFESSDALDPRDTNGAIDVYEWEKTGATSGCSEDLSSYSPINNGCIQLISSGSSARASEFDDASPSGDDVFFSTLESLVPQDYGLVDVYDARVGGGLPVPPGPPAECVDDGCQHPEPAPGAATPGSLGYEGPGNVGKQPVQPKCHKGKVRRGGRCVKKKHHRGHRKHHRRKASAAGGRAGR